MKWIINKHSANIYEVPTVCQALDYIYIPNKAKREPWALPARSSQSSCSSPTATDPVAEPGRPAGGGPGSGRRVQGRLQRWRQWSWASDEEQVTRWRGGGSTFQAEETAHEQAESWKHMPRCGMTSSPAQLERKGAHKLKRPISFRLVVNPNQREVHLHITLSAAQLGFC